jgi:hypothetical protein
MEAATCFYRDSQFFFFFFADSGDETCEVLMSLSDTSVVGLLEGNYGLRLLD